MLKAVLAMVLAVIAAALVTVGSAVAATGGTGHDGQVCCVWQPDWWEEAPRATAPARANPSSASTTATATNPTFTLISSDQAYATSNPPGAPPLGSILKGCHAQACSGEWWLSFVSVVSCDAVAIS